MRQKLKVAIIDDEKDVRESISQWLTLSGFETQEFQSAQQALKVINKDYPGVIISDIKMPDLNGIEFLKKLMIKDSTIPVILITGHGDVSMAVEAMHLGAYDFLEKPFDPNKIVEISKRALINRKLVLDNRSLRRELSDGTVLLKKLVGSSREMIKLREDILDFGRADGHIFITGEIGTGKTLIAQAIHACGARQGREFITFNCAAYPVDEIENKLFNRPIDQNVKPIFEQVSNGTLCLESVEQMPKECQNKLLAHIKSRDYSSEKYVRLISISEGKNKKDVGHEILPSLFYRLSSLNLEIPPLRKRGNDILELFNHFLDLYSDEYGYNSPEINAVEAAQLLQASWPGNVRQLINLAEKAVLHHKKRPDSLSKLLFQEINASEQIETDIYGRPLKEHVEAFEKMLIDNTMKRMRGSITAVMKELGLPRRTLNEKMAKYQLSRSNYL